MTNLTTLVEAGFDLNGQSAVLEIKKIGTLNPLPTIPSFNITNLYYVNELHLTTQSKHDDAPYDINLPPNAIRFLICRIPPINDILKVLNDSNIVTPEDFIKIGMHKTPSVDYGYIANGNITLFMGNGDTYNFKKGDTYTMRGADHAWINYGESYCEIVGLMIGVSS